MTIFGPGVGECIVLHLGAGEWMIVDSCVPPVGVEPIALEYLKSIGVDPASSVRALLATHWHDDHIQGMAKLVRTCARASFLMSGALAGRQFRQLVLEVDEQNKLVKHNSSASEFAEILEILASRASSRFVVGPSTYAQDGTQLFRGGHKDNTEVWALSPSAATVTNALASLAERLVTGGEVRRFKRFSANDLSVAVLVRAESLGLLLGADLENTKASEFGWKAIMGTRRFTDKSQAFKIAHHGSANAHHDDVWNTMLIDDPIAVVTPYAALRNPLPTSDDVRRIKSRTGRAFCTTWPQSRKPPRRKGVDGIVGGATKSRRVLNPEWGYIRIRFDLSDPIAMPSIELFGSAKQL